MNYPRGYRTAQALLGAYETATSGKRPRDAVIAAAATAGAKLVKRKFSKTFTAKPKVANKFSKYNPLVGLASRTAAPVTYGSTIVSRKPKLSGSARSNTQRIVHRELILSSVSGSTSFSVQNAISLQPGLSVLLPWGNTISRQYEQYRIRDMSFVWVPFISTGTPGSIMMMVDYNAADLPPVTETQFMDHAGAVTSSAWEEVVFRCDVSQMHALGPRKYVRSCSVAGDIKTYDCGQFYLATDNGTAIPWGKVYVEYDIELFIPQLNPPTYALPTSTSGGVVTIPEPFTSGVAGAVSLANLTYDALDIGPVSAGVFTPPAGFYHVVFTITCADTVSETFTGVLNFFKNGANFPANYNVNFKSAAVAGNADVLVSDTLVSMNGTDTMGYSLTLTGATGVLTIFAYSLVISLA